MSHIHITPHDMPNTPTKGLGYMLEPKLPSSPASIGKIRTWLVLSSRKGSGDSSRPSAVIGQGPIWGRQKMSPRKSAREQEVVTPWIVRPLMRAFVADDRDGSKNIHRLPRHLTRDPGSGLGH